MDMIIMDEDTRRKSSEGEVENKILTPEVRAKSDFFPRNSVYHACHKHSASLCNKDR